jgi:UbiD family decarboxylase
MVETEYPDDYLKIKEPIDPRFDMTAIVFELDRAGKNPVVVLDRVDGYDMPVVTNVAANRRLLAACPGVDSRDLPGAFRERCQNYIPCETVAHAAWNDVVIEGNDGAICRTCARCMCRTRPAARSWH